MENKDSPLARLGLFKTYWLVGYLFAFGSYLVDFWLVTPNSMLVVYVGLVALCAALPVFFCARDRRTTRQHLCAVASCLLGGGLLGAIPVLVSAMVVSAWGTNVPSVEAFGKSDFAICDLDSDKVVTYHELDLFVTRQSEIKSSIDTLEKAKHALKATAVQSVSAAAAIADIDRVKGELQSQLLPEDQMGRINVVRMGIAEIGHTVTNPAAAGAGGPEYGVTQQEIASYGQRLEAKYRPWFAVMLKLHFAQ